MSGTLINSVNNIVTSNIVPNHLNIFDPSMNSNNAINHVDIFPSLIAARLLSYATSIADWMLLPLSNSSFILSYIKIFESTAIQIDSITAAIHDRDSA